LLLRCARSHDWAIAKVRDFMETTAAHSDSNMHNKDRLFAMLTSSAQD
jgi:hypothetical protein